MTFLRGLAVLLLASFFLVTGAAYAPVALAAPSENNIKLIIDVSGSMKKNDPENLRRPAVNLLMNLLPEDANAGVWLFGDEVEVLVPFGQATSQFKARAIQHSDLIHSRGLLTDLGGALEQAMMSPPIDSKAILLSDGMVDLGPDVATNQAETTGIKRIMIPQLRSNGAEIHTVALSIQADEEVLNEIAVGTGGLFETAESPEDLTRIFLRLFDDAVIQDRLPLEDGVFLVDSSVEEFTLLALHDAEATPIQLRSPDNEFYLAGDHPSFVSWYTDAGYDLITISRPSEGAWKLFADEDPQNRITAVSDLKLEVTNLPNMIHEGAIPSLEVQFSQSEGKITESHFLDLMDAQLIVLTPDGKRIAKPLEDYQNGTLSADLGVFAEPGRYRITVNVDGRSFKREVVQEVEYGSPAKLVFTDATQTLTVRPVAAGMLDNQMRMIARIESPDAKKELVPLKYDGEMWLSKLSDIEPGQYRVTVHVKGVASSGQPLDFDLPALDIDIKPPVVDEEAGREETILTLDNYLLIDAILAANVVLLGLIFWFVRRRPVKQTDQEVEALIDGVETDHKSETTPEQVEAALSEAKAMQANDPPEETPEPVESPVETSEADAIDETKEPEAVNEAVKDETEEEVAVETEPETESGTESGEGLSDIVDALSNSDADEDETKEEVDENAETVKFDPPTTSREAELEAEMEAAIDEADEVDENAKTVQLDTPVAEPGESPENDEAEVPADEASSG
jgi:uncharacterized protein (TIGR03503 family)